MCASSRPAAFHCSVWSSSHEKQAAAIVPALQRPDRWRETTIIKRYYTLRHDFLQWHEHIAGSRARPKCWSKLEKGPFCLSFDYTRCFNNTVYTHTDVPKHRLYYCAYTNRYTDMQRPPTGWKPGLHKRGLYSQGSGLSAELQAHLNVRCFFMMFILYKVLLTVEKQLDHNG